MHKGFKCLDVSIGRVYISRGVVFDENIFLFAKLHPNASAKLRSKILLLPPCLLASKSLHNGVNILDESIANIPNPVQNSGVYGGVQLADLDDTSTNEDSCAVSCAEFRARSTCPGSRASTEEPCACTPWS
jgi:hypothetical protein